MLSKVHIDLKVVWFCLYQLGLAGFALASAWNHDIPFLLVMGFLMIGNLIWDYMYFRKEVIELHHVYNINLSSKKKAKK